MLINDVDKYVRKLNPKLWDSTIDSFNADSDEDANNDDDNDDDSATPMDAKKNIKKERDSDDDAGFGSSLAF